MKGQTAVELVVILAVSLLILFVILSLSAQYLGELSSSKSMAEARNGVDDLAAAAKQVYYQGEGAKQQVFVKIPEGTDAQKSGITNRTISLNVLGSDVVARTDFEIKGRIPTTPGGYSVWVNAKRGYVLIGTMSLSAEPGSLFVHFFSKNQSQSSQQSVVFKNDGESEMAAELNMEFPSGDVNVTFSNPSDTNFQLQPGESKEVLLDFNVAEGAFGSYGGMLYANSSNGDELAVNIIVDVTSQICTTPSCPSAGMNCTPHYVVIETFNDSTYTNFKEIFDSSEYVTIGGSGWTPSSQITVDIKDPGGASVAGYPKLVTADQDGIFSEQWDTAGAITGTYTVHANDSTKKRSYAFDITACT
ncbi:MAG: hypothetical protein Sv326_0580 [Candidatus Fermentimicrarchaeum limneticum]|uniref:Uncharacterized protein n=1 Tax=Fermentimicrarchaeum limneticum TaxID=2795018 RepID=A0A7D6BGS3_FERL1|nr:MAG: hypothetical protein Sv326_0580 [Candidatus Fermentimicrarchaeum limneticum]